MLRGALFGFLILSPMLVLALAGQAGLRFNHTQSFPVGSFPVGIDWAVPKHPEKGDLVSFRPPVLPVFDLARERGYLDRGECRLKRLVAAGDDTMTIDAGGVTVNGRRLANSAPRRADLAGRPIARLPPARLPAPAWRGQITRPSALIRVTF